ncbi:MAG TPA: hypothetical protein VFV10_04570 [Gammaproteobacteria bacterium]|nr:hypothetical protein [Gammaproteobacteria bacterium]
MGRIGRPRRALISVAEAARAAGVSRKVMLARLHRLEEHAGGGILVSYQPRGKKPRKYWVNAEAMRVAITGAAPELERRLEETASKVALLEKKLERLALAHKALKHQAKPPR